MSAADPSWNVRGREARYAEPVERSAARQARRYAFALAGVYFVVAALWVGFSDRAISLLGLPLDAERLIAAVKGQAFVLVTAIMLYALAYRHLRRLHSSEARYRRLVEGSPDIVYSVSHDRGGLYHSPRVEAILGYTPEHFSESPYFWLECVHPDDRGRLDSAIEASFAGHPLDIEYRIKDARGHWRWLHDRSIGTLVVGEDRITEGVATDVTDRKEAQERIRELNYELEERVSLRTTQLQAANSELESFSYSVSHDLRAPLRHIAGYVDLLLGSSRSQLDETAQHYLDSIAQAAAHMGTLIDDLLEFSRTSRAELRIGEVDMNAALNDSIAALADDVAGRPVEWVVPTLPIVTGDAAMLRLVWRNLLENAVKYTRGRQPARIEVRVQELPEEYVFSVADNGAGFDMRYADKLFGVFERLHSPSEFEGTGVGLANVRRIVDRHGGRTWAEAELAVGATFYFSIPRQRPLG